MAITVQAQNLNVRPGNSSQTVVHLSQGDTGNTIRFFLYDGNSEFDVSSYTVTVHGVRADGVGWGPYATSPVANHNNGVQFNLKSLMTSVAGASVCQLVIANNAGAAVGTANFAFLVENATFPDGPVYANDVSVYSQILAYVQGAVIPEEAIIIDSTLTISTAAAQAKAVGDALTAVNSTVGTLSSTVANMSDAVVRVTSDNGIEPAEIQNVWKTYEPVAGKKLTGYNGTTKEPTIANDDDCNYAVLDLTGENARAEKVAVPIFSGTYAAVQLWDDNLHVLGTYSLGNVALNDPASYPTAWIWNIASVQGDELVINIRSLFQSSNFVDTKYIAFTFGGTGYIRLNGEKRLDWNRVTPDQITGKFNLSDPVPGVVLNSYNGTTHKATYKTFHGGSYSVVAMSDVENATTLTVPLFPASNDYGAIQLWDGWGHVLGSFNASNNVMNNRASYPTAWVWNIANVADGKITINLNTVRNNSNFSATKYIAFSFAESEPDRAYVVSNEMKTLEWAAFGETAKDEVRAYCPKLLVADTYYAVVGRELNLYFDQIYECWDWRGMNIMPSYQYTGTGAKIDNDRISIIPTTAGTFTLEIWTNIIVNGTRYIFKKTGISVIVTAASLPNVSKKVMFLGDSRSDNARLSKPAKEWLEGAIELVGTRETNGYKHEGRSGWTAEKYCTLATYDGITNPFYNPGTNSFDFAYYLQETRVPVPNYVNILLGVNGNYSAANVQYMEAMVQSIHAYDSSIIVTIMQDYALPQGCGYSVGSLLRRGLGLMHHTLILDQFGGRTSEKIYVVEAGSGIDNYYDFPTISTASASAYNPTERTVIRDAIHMLTYGYDKLISVWGAFFLANES